MKRLLLAIAAAAAAAAPAGSKPAAKPAAKTATTPISPNRHGAATPLFASDEMIRVTISGPVMAVARTGGRPSAPRPAMLMLHGARPETHAILLSPRGITRRKSDICQFGPLRVELAAKPDSGSLLAGQRRLKLVTHCRSAESFQQYLLLEYAAYRMYNALTPLSFRVRLATIDYVGENGKTIVSRLGFFIEDADDAARRNGLREARVGDRIASAQLAAADAARFGMFQYMIGNLDWSMTAAPAGEGCCHNARLAGREGAGSNLVPLPYDFDFAGMVDAPYAVPPNSIDLPNVRVRLYRGYCRLDAEARAAAAQLAARKTELIDVLGRIPQLDERNRRKAAAYLSGFFEEAADQDFAKRMRRDCVG